MKTSKRLFIEKGKLILWGEGTIYIKKRNINIRECQKTQKDGFLSLLLQFAPLALNLLGNMGGRGVKPPPPDRAHQRHPRRY